MQFRRQGSTSSSQTAVPDSFCSSRAVSSEDSLESKSKWASRQRLCCERAAGFALKPGTLESRNCSNYSGGLCLTKTLYKRGHFTKPARVSLRSLRIALIKGVIIINLAGGGGPGSKATCRLCPQARDSGIQELQQLFWRPLPYYSLKNGAISQSRQGYPLRALRIALIKGVIIINPAGAGGPGSKAFFRRLFGKQKQMGLETEAVL